MSYKIVYFYDSALDFEYRLYSDSEHPWPYYEGLGGSDGMCFTFLIPKEVSKETIQTYKRKLRNERDVVDVKILRGVACDVSRHA